jgi:hyperosmotically inducible protein
MLKTPSLTLSTIAVVVAAMAMAACNKRDDVGAIKNGDNTAVVTGQPNAGDQAQKAADDAKVATKDAATDVKDASKSAADQATNKVADALITTSVKAELAKDSQLSALRINVDTDNGRVALKGAAPDAGSKERATQLASAVKGVVSVDNQLTVDSKS